MATKLEQRELLHIRSLQLTLAVEGATRDSGLLDAQVMALLALPYEVSDLAAEMCR
jgi:hypothetical protein